MKLVLFEDNYSEKMYPLSLFSPLFDLRTGSMTLRSLVELLDIPIEVIIRDHFRFDGERNGNFLKHNNDSLLFLNASVEPDIGYLEAIKDIIKSGDPFLTTSRNRVAAAVVPPEKKLPEEITVGEISPLLLEMNLPLEREMFRTIDRPHEAVSSHLKVFNSNLDYIISSGNYHEPKSGLFLGEDVNLAPSTVVDTDKGPVVLDNGAAVMHFTYFEGPVHIGRGSRIIEHSSLKDNTSVGIRCKLGGEVEASSIDSFSNKQHHGFLGHSWVGKWVNLGAGTSSSDLKNTYGKIRVDYEGKRIETNMQFLGSVIGDYAKTAVNTSLFTGKIVGVCSMIYGTVTSNVPSFSNYAKSFGQVTEISFEQIIKTQKRMFDRRGQAQTSNDIELMKRVFEITRHERTMSDEQINF